MGNIIDKTIGFFSPEAALRRHKARQKLQRSYDGASKGLHTQGWQRVSDSSGNAEVQVAHQLLVNRSHDLIRNNAYAFRAQEMSIIGWIGQGLVGTIKGTKGLVERRKKDWEAWANDKRECDYLGQKNFAAIQVEVCRAFFAGGECLIRKIPVDDNKTIPLRLQVLEGVHLDIGRTGNLDNGNRVVQGVEYGKSGRVVAYWIFPEHPGDGGSFKTLRLQSERVDADEIIYVGEPLRPNQARGLPRLTNVIINLKDFGDLRINKLTQQQIAACFAAFITGNDLEDGDVNMGEIIERLEPGLIENLGNNRNIHFAQPPNADNSIDFDKSILREISVGAGVTYEDLTNDLSNVSFISGRLGRINFYHLAGMTRNTILIPMFFDEVYRWFEEACVVSGRGIGKSRIVWTPPPQDMLDPMKQTGNLIDQIEGKLISRHEAIRQYGRDPLIVDQEIQDDTVIETT